MTPKVKEEKTRESDDEFEPDDGQSTDDEETIAQEEKLNQGDSTVKLGEKDEIDALKRESEMPLDELLDDLPPEYLESLRNPSARSKESDEVTIFVIFRFWLRIESLPHHGPIICAFGVWNIS